MWSRDIIIMGNAQTHTMTAIMSQATRLPATSHVQITMSATMMTVMEARPAVWVMSSEARTHLTMKGRSQKNAGVSSKLETRKMLGRILKARLLIVGNNVAGRVEKHITLVATKEQLDCADF